ncbi:1,6-anhydro-N-acetylmuramyl-L-alanine amidase AmpD, partial [Pseudomonas aeruginosa]
MHFDSVTGWVRGVRHCPSPNFNLRPQGDAVSLLVIHNISLPPGQFGTGKVQAFFQNRLDPNEHPYFEEIRHLTVSAHFLIERDGAITQFVSCHDRAWHAGVSCFDGREACNDFSLGIELEGTYALHRPHLQLTSPYPGCWAPYFPVEFRHDASRRQSAEGLSL